MCRPNMAVLLPFCRPAGCQAGKTDAWSTLASEDRSEGGGVKIELTRPSETSTERASVVARKLDLARRVAGAT